MVKGLGVASMQKDVSAFVSIHKAKTTIQESGGCSCCIMSRRRLYLGYLVAIAHELRLIINLFPIRDYS